MFIAELGINHHGDTEHAMHLVDCAADSGCDAIKLQYRGVDFYFSKEEIGDEIVAAEIERTRLSYDQIHLVLSYARKKALKIGMSVFRIQDAKELIDQGFKFEFWKVPSAECENRPLVEFLLNYGDVYISTGGADLKSFGEVYKELRPKLNVMHCIANYPVLSGFQSFGCVAYLREQGWKSVGYSSHDGDYECAFVAMGVGIDSLERHIVLSKDDGGLDSSSSSTPDEFKRLGKLFHQRKLMMLVPVERNQGEIINLQNLGTSLYLKAKIKAGDEISFDDVVIAAPRKGISVGEFMKKPKYAHRDLSVGQVLASSDIESSQAMMLFSSAEKILLQELNIGLPVRLHDHHKFREQFGLDYHEFHLSHGEVLSDQLFDFANTVPTDTGYSVHLPDYISPNDIINPFSNNKDIRDLSNKIIARTVEFARILTHRGGRPCNIVGSFPYSDKSAAEYVDDLYSYLERFEVPGVEILPQWLPKIGWYFGGACHIDTFNNFEYVSLVERKGLKICLDVCHLIMSANYANEKWESWYEKLIPHARHIHLADARGISEEGLPLLSGDLKGCVLNNIKGIPVILEVWQGHLNNGLKFHNDLKIISNNEVLR
jgi:N-acetylneuraminate synthase